MKKWVWGLFLTIDCVFMFVCMIGFSSPDVTEYIRRASMIGSVGLILCGVFFLVKYVQADLREKETRNAPVLGRSKKQAGMDYEMACAKRLIRQGYTNVKLTPASGDFGADILAVHPKGYRICFQCKFYSGNAGVEAVQEVLSAVRYYGADCGAVMTNADFTPAARELARRSDVALIPHCDAHLDWIDRVEDFDAIWN